MIFRITISILLFDLSSAKEWEASIICSRKFNRCYQYFEKSLQFNEAENKCVELGGQLASIEDPNENEFIRQVAEMESITSYWISVNKSATNTLEYNWADGTPSVRFKPSDDRMTGLCLIVNSGEWHQAQCDLYLPYICAFSNKNITACSSPTAISQNLRTVSCEIGWTYLPKTNSCYTVFHNANWNESERSCVAQGAHLTSIHSEVENTFINDLSSTGKEVINITEFTWIGLHQVGKEWVWTDGSKTDYLKWTSNQPDRERDNLCVQIASDVSYYKWDKEWNNLDCDSAMRAYVCKKPSES